MEQFEIVLLIFVMTVCLLVVAQRIRGHQRPSAVLSSSLNAHVTRHKLKISQSGGQRHIVLDGVEIRDANAITDPALRAALARGEEALAQAERTLKAPLPKS